MRACEAAHLSHTHGLTPHGSPRAAQPVADPAQQRGQQPWARLHLETQGNISAAAQQQSRGHVSGARMQFS